MNKLTVEEIAKIFYETHEEQCCTCPGWDELEWDPDTNEMVPRTHPENFMLPAQKVHEAIYGLSN